MHTEKRQDQLQKNSGKDRVQGGNPDLRENNPPEGVAEADRAFGQRRGKRSQMADWFTFMQREKGADNHAEEEAHKQMYRFFASVLQFLGMLVKPNRGQCFQIIDIARQIIHNPGRQFRASIRNDTLHLLEKRLQVAYITLEESNRAQDQEDKNAHGDSCQRDKGN